MLTLPLAPSPVFNSQIESISKYALKAVSTCMISDKIKAVAAIFFKGCTSLYLCAFGTMEMGQNIKKDSFVENSLSTQDKVINSSASYLNLHGTLLFSSGTLGLMDALQGFGLVNFRSLAQAVSTASSTLFLCANVVALDENVRLLNELMITDWSKTNITDQELKWMKQSAFWGMLSNLGYIVTTASLLFSGATALTILMAAFSCCTGGIKILFDLLAWAKTQKLF